MIDLEEISKKVTGACNITDKHNRKSVMARMIYIYESLRREIKTLDQFLDNSDFTRGQVHYVLYEFRMKLKRDEYFKSLYLKVLEEELNEKYKQIIFN